MGEVKLAKMSAPGVMPAALGGHERTLIPKVSTIFRWLCAEHARPKRRAWLPAMVHVALILILLR